MGSLLGGQKSSSKNVAYPWISQNFGDSWAQPATGSVNMLGNVLGLNGPGAGQQALQDYYNSTGGQFLMNQGVSNLTDKFGKLGLLRSGSFGKALEGYRQNLASTKLDNYLGQLGNLAKLGLGAGGLVAEAGQTSKGSSGGGIGSLLGSALTAAAMA